MADNSPEESSQIADYLLAGAYLDNIRVYSSELLLCFTRLNEQEKPGEVWVSSTGRIRAAGLRHLSPFTAETVADQRGVALYALCQLIGEEVSSVQISASGALDIFLGDWGVHLEPDEVNTEEVWSIVSDSPDPAYPHRWSVTLDDVGNLLVHTPGKSVGSD